MRHIGSQSRRPFDIAPAYGNTPIPPIKEQPQFSGTLFPPLDLFQTAGGLVYAAESRAILEETIHLSATLDTSVTTPVNTTTTSSAPSATVSTAPPHTPAPSTPEQKRKALWMVVAFTLMASVAQVLYKMGANALNKVPAGSVVDLALGSLHFHISAALVAVATNVPMIVGLSLYGMGAVMMVLALQHGELSVLYPIISLSYVWVAILSVLVFHEHLNVYRIGGIAVIIWGVAVLGRSGSR